MSDLLIWFAAGCLGAVIMLAGVVIGWKLRRWFYTFPEPQQLGVRVCDVCHEPIARGIYKQADGRWVHPHCKAVA